MKYDPSKIEKKWQEKWEKDGTYKVSDKVKGKENFYHLTMLPYASGNLHIGHWYNFAPGDIYARKKRMEGYNVISPMGFDSFGLPAEGAAIKHGIHPHDWTEQNCEKMTEQLKSIGAIYDWDRVVYSHRPDYYKWTQWMFLQMYKNGLAYKKEANVNWCPSCKSILANEQASGGKCWRCESLVEQRNVKQWFFKITDYADQLLKDLEQLDWPNKTVLMQKNWIDRSEGIRIDFEIDGGDKKIQAFTTRPDTIFGVTFFALAPEHSIVQDLTVPEQKEKVEKYVEKAKRKTELERKTGEKDKTGIFTGSYVLNPITKEKIPVYVADFVLAGYGTGAMMGVPGHDQRDWDFAKQHNLEIKEVISGGDVSKQAHTDIKDGKLVNSKEYDDMDCHQAIKKISNSFEKQGIGKKEINYRLRDWLVSRQRYWGSPIPIVYCDKCEEVAIPEKDLPVLLPNIKDYTPKEEDSPLARSEKFVKTTCPKCGGEAKRDTDTMDTFVCSSWYYFRYIDPKNKKEFALKKKLRSWLPVNIYIGGAEHTVLHLLYSRFFTKALRDMGYLDFDEPFMKLRHQGIIAGEDGSKMSKSKGNVVDPDGYVQEYGADVVRLYLGFMGPYDQGGPWSPKGIQGVYRFLNKVWDLKNVLLDKDNLSQALINQTIKKVGDDLEEFKFNTALSCLMTFTNQAQKQGFSKENYKILIRLLASFAPHLTEELWEQIGEKFSVHNQSWPKYDESLITQESTTLIVQINGKVRDKIEINSEMNEKEIKELVLESDRVKKWIQDKQVKKFVYIKNKIANIVI